MTLPKKILFFGIYKPSAPRDRAYFEGLRKQGIEILECVDHSPSFIKYIRLSIKLISFRGKYDLLWVGYLSGMTVIIARIFSRKKIIFNALSSMYETSVLGRHIYSRYSPSAWIIWVSDYLSFHLADAVLLESEEQKRYIAKSFFVKQSKLFSVFIGTNTEIFYPDPSIKKRSTFSVVFRGMFISDTGVEYVIETARILKNEDIDFLVIGWGQLLDKIKKMIVDYNLSRLTLHTTFIPAADLHKMMLECHVMLGQFSSNSRLDRVIQHKNIEAMALGMPFITRDSVSNRELHSEGEDCIFVKAADAVDLARAIVILKNDSKLRDKLSSGALKTYQEKLAPEVLSDQVMLVISQCFRGINGVS